MQPSHKTSMHHRRFVELLQQELHPNRLIPTLTAAIIAGTIEIIYAISFVALIFSGDLAPYISTGIGLSLFTSMVVSLVLAFRSSASGVISGTQDAPAVILGVMAVAIIARATPTPTPSILPTILVALALSSILTSLCCFLLGHFKLGNLIRFIPYPVVGGFLAGTGWLLLLGSLSFMTTLSSIGEQWLQLFQPQHLPQWLPGCLLGGMLVILLRRYQHFLLMPGLLVGAIALFYIALFATHTSIADAQTFGLLLPAFPSGSLWHPRLLSDLGQADWSYILPQISQMAAVMLITVISILLNSTGIELATGQDLDLNHELRAAGTANLLSGLGGGIIGFHVLGSSILTYSRIGAKSRLVGVLISIGIALVLFAGASLISLFPKPVLGGVTLFLGLDLLWEWVYESRFKLAKTDYFIVLLILLIIATVGFLQGVAVGLVVAIALFVINYSQVNVARHTLSGSTYHSNTVRSLSQSRLLQEEGDQIYILDLQGFLFFGTANTLLNQIQDRLRDSNRLRLKFVVLNFQSVSGLDSSVVLSFIKLKQLFQQHDIKLILTHLNSTIHSQLVRSGCLSANDSVCQIFPDLDRGLEWCENELLGQIPLRRSRFLPLVLQLNDLFPNGDHAPEFMEYLEEWDADKSDMLFQQNHPADAIYFIEVGQVTVYFEPQPGQTRRIQTLGAGHLVGELDFFRNTSHQTSAIVDAPSTLYRLSSKNFQQMQQEKPEVAATFQSAVIQVMGDRLTSAYKEIANLLGS